MADKPQIIVNGFRHAGVYSALGLLDEDELPDYSEISVESDYDDESDVQDDDDSSSSDEIDVVDDNDSSSSDSEADERSSPHFLVEDIFTDSDYLAVLHTYMYQ